MSQKKKVMITLAAVAVFLIVTGVFAAVMMDHISLNIGPDRSTEQLDAFPRAVPETSESTEPVPTETEETIPETEPTVSEAIPVETEPRHLYDAVPLFYMTDYPDVYYRSGTLATSGSNIASLAMVASYLTGHEYRPDELADYFADYIGNSMEWLEYASDELQLPWTKAANFHVAKQALQEGKIVITLLGEKSIFTQTQHFIVLTGINEEGRITVNDPYEPHYSQWNLEKGLASGFEDTSIITGYHGSWVYDPGAMTEDPFIYQPEENADEFRYEGLEITDADKELMAKIICLEAQSEPYEGQQAIAEVIFNRLAAGNFQDSVRAIIYAEGQFKSADQLYAAEPTHTQYVAVERALNGPYVLPKDVVFFATFAVNDNVWGKIGAHTFCYQW